MKPLVLLFLTALPLAGCDAEPIHYQCSHPEFTSEDYGQAGLNIVGLWDTNVTSDSAIQQTRDRAIRMRKWAEKIDDPCMRYQVKRWIDFQLQQSEESYVNRGKRNLDEANRDQERAQEQMRVQDLRDRTQLPVSKPE